MKLTRILAIAAAAAALISAQAFAADLSAPRTTTIVPVSAPAGWTGLYVGVNGGYGNETKDQSIAGANPNGVAIVNFGLVPSNLNTHGGGGLFGLQAGYNYQLNNSFVVGAETDLDWSGVKGADSQHLGIGPIGLDTNGSTKLKWLGSLRARGGYLVTPTTLLYVTGGLAYGSVESASSVSLTAPPPFATVASADTTSTKLGWTVGTGLEQAISTHLSLKAEYRYTDLGSVDNTYGATIAGAFPVSFTSHQDLRYHTFTAGLNYRF